MQSRLCKPWSGAVLERVGIPSLVGSIAEDAGYGPGRWSAVFLLPDIPRLGAELWLRAACSEGRDRG